MIFLLLFLYLQYGLIKIIHSFLVSINLKNSTVNYKSRNRMCNIIGITTVMSTVLLYEDETRHIYIISYTQFTLYSSCKGTWYVVYAEGIIYYIDEAEISYITALHTHPHSVWAYTPPDQPHVNLTADKRDNSPRSCITEFSDGGGLHSIWLSIISQKASTAKFPGTTHQPATTTSASITATVCATYHHSIDVDSRATLTSPHASLICTTLSFVNFIPPSRLHILRNLISTRPAVVSSRSPRKATAWPPPPPSPTTQLVVFRFVRLFTCITYYVCDCVVFYIICTTRQTTTTLCVRTILYTHAHTHIHTI